ADLEYSQAYYSYSVTMINSKSYHILYESNYYTPDWDIFNYKEIVGYIYEDSINGKYWLLKDNYYGGYEENIFMDLSLKVGDKFCFLENHSLQDSIEVLSVYMINNK
ncbi:MAG: hypothetical protein QG635_576, partial [Bacteroidota bacterium]|nr:hypothetical protein [Bacteroidota bacterium]